MFYIKGGLIILISIFGVFGSFGAVDFDLISIGQALKQVCVSVALIAVIAHLEEVMGVVYYLLHGLFKTAQWLPQYMRRVT